MSVYELILKRRTVRKFTQEKIASHILEKMVDAARLAPSGANMQPLKYIIVDQDEKVKSVFELVKWAAYIAPNGTPEENQRPVAFIAVLADTHIRKSGYELDAGAAIQNILLTAKEEGIGSCWMGAIDRVKIGEVLKIHERFTLISVIALGYEGETPIAENETGSMKYYKDEEDILHVPKRKLSDIIV